MKKRQSPAAQKFLAMMSGGLDDRLRLEVRFVVTGSTGAFDGDLSRLPREMRDSGAHIRIFTALGGLWELRPEAVREAFKALPPARQQEIDAMVKAEIADAIQEQDRNSGR